MRYAIRWWLDPPLKPEHQARLDGWVEWLDVDLQAAQAALRHPPHLLPPLPFEAEVEPEPEPIAQTALRGAYARRAAARAQKEPS